MEIITMENSTEGKKTILIPSLSEEDAGVAVATVAVRVAEEATTEAVSHS